MNFQETIQGEQLLLVDFSAAWCGPCKMMEPILGEVAASLGPKVKVEKVDVDKNPMAARNYSVRGVPTLMLIHKGKVLWRQSGVMQARDLIAQVNSYALN